MTEEKRVPKASSARFEDLEVWQAARLLVRDIYQTTSAGGYARDFGLRDQTRRSAVSVMSNIAEGNERGRPNEYFNFLCTAKGSCAEVRSQLYVALDVGYLGPPEFDCLMAQAREVGLVVGGLRSAIEKKRDRR